MKKPDIHYIFCWFELLLFAGISLFVVVVGQKAAQSFHPGVASSGELSEPQFEMFSGGIR